MADFFHIPLSESCVVTSYRRLRAGFTIVELLVVLAIIGVLLALLMPAVQSARAAARRAQCRSNLHQLGIALHSHHDARGSFPPAHDHNFWSWLSWTLPYMDEGPLFERIPFEDWAWPADPDPHYATTVSTILPVLLCPSDPRSHTISVPYRYASFAYTNYLGVTGTQGGVHVSQYVGDGMFPAFGAIVYRAPTSWYSEGERVPMKTVTDGASNTLHVGERPVVDWSNHQGDFGWWAAGYGLDWLPSGRADNVLDSSEGLRPGTPPADSIDDLFHWWSQHPGGAHFLYVDGSVRFRSYDIEHAALLALSSRDGGEVVATD